MLSLTFAGRHRHCATGRGDRLAVRSNREGQATECASLVARHSQVMSTSGE